MELNKNITFSEFPIPQSFDAECGVLAELIGNEQYFTLSAGVLNEDCFYAPEAKEAYKALCVMVEAGEHIDLMTASQRINKAFYMANIITKESYASEATFLSHCEVLSTLNQKRKLYFACCRGIQMSNSMGATKEEMMQFPTALANEITDGVYVNSTKQIGTIINELGEAIEKDDTKRVPTGFPSLDRMVYGGFSAGNLVVLAARPSVGKTSIMLQMAREAAGKGIPSLVLSLEMTNNELAQRLLFSTHLINAYEVANKKVDWANFEKAGAVFSGSKLYMDETPQTLDEVCSVITIAHQRGQCEIAYIDYLQLMSTPESRNSLYQQVTETTKKIKKLAKKLNIPIVLLCQLNRNSVSEHRQPQLHDLRDSGSIEQDADIVLMLERLKDTEGALTNRVNMYVRKNRGGLAGDITIELESDNNYTTFVEVTNYD